MTVRGVSGDGPGAGPRVGLGGVVVGGVVVAGALVPLVGAGAGRVVAGGALDVVVGGRLDVVVGAGGAQIGKTELRDSSSIWRIASSRLPDGSPAITWARSEGRMSLTPSKRQFRFPWDWSALISDSSLREFRQPRR